MLARRFGRRRSRGQTSGGRLRGHGAGRCRWWDGEVKVVVEAASQEISKLNDRVPMPSAGRAREMGLLGCEKGEEEESRPRCPSWI